VAAAVVAAALAGRARAVAAAGDGAVAELGREHAAAGDDGERKQRRRSR
jgi:hypothetical protein